MQVPHETIYQTLIVQGRGHLRADLHQHLRTGRAIRRDRGEPRRASWSKIRDMVLFSERPAEADDRAVPGHREGDLIVGTNARSAIGTLVERTQGPRDLLLRPSQALAARLEREHRRPAPAVLPEIHRPHRPHPGTAPRRRHGTQRQTPQTLGYRTPAEAFEQLLSDPKRPPVATTP